MPSPTLAPPRTTPCPICATPMTHPATGRRRVTCSDACRKKHDRQKDAQRFDAQAARVRALLAEMTAAFEAVAQRRRPAR